MNKSRVCIMMFLALLAVLIVADASFAAVMHSVDVGNAKVASKGLANLGKGLPAVTSVVIAFYVFQSFILVMLTDQQFHRWAVRVLLGILVTGVFMGGTIGKAVGWKRPAKKPAATASAAPSRFAALLPDKVAPRKETMALLPDKYAATTTDDTVTTISQATFDTYPGEGAKESATPGSSATKFEVLATMFNNEDETLASGVGDNLAMVQTITETDHTMWSLPGPASSGGATSSALGFIKDLFATSGALDPGGYPTSTTAPPQAELLNAIGEINENEQEADVLNGMVLYLYNSITHVAGDRQAQYDAKQIEKANEGDEATGGSGDPAAFDPNDVFAEANMTVASQSTSPVTVVTLATYPGGVEEYGRHALSTIAEPDRRFHAGTIPAEQITKAIEDSGQRPGQIDYREVKNFPEPTASGAGTLFDNAKAAGFDPQTNGVYPQLYLRTHKSLQQQECQTNGEAAGIRVATNATVASLGMMNPCANIPSSPIAGNVQQMQNFYTQAFGILDGLSNPNADLNSIAKGIAQTANMYNAFQNFHPQFSACQGGNAPTNVAGILAQYDSVINDAENNGVSYAKNCLKNGKAMLTIMSAVDKTRGVNDRAYHRYLDPVYAGGAGAEAESTLAWSISKADANTGLPEENMASISDIVGHVTALVGSIGVSGHKGSANTKSPNAAQETSGIKPDQYMQKLIKKYQDKQATADKASWMTDPGAKISGIAAGAMEFLVRCALEILRIICILFTGIPFIALLTQVSVATTVAKYSIGIGTAMIPIWGVMNLGKLFTGSSMGDDSYNGMTFFPIVSVIVSFAAIGAEGIVAVVCQGEVEYYFAHIVDLATAQISSIIAAICGALMNNAGYGELISFNSVLRPMIECTKPFGICAAAVLGPIMIAKMLTPGIISPHGAQGNFSSMGTTSPFNQKGISMGVANLIGLGGEKAGMNAGKSGGGAGSGENASIAGAAKKAAGVAKKVASKGAA